MRPKGLTIWHARGLPDYTPVEAKLPVVQNTQTQVATGTQTNGATIVSNGEVTAAHTSIHSNSLGILVLKPGDTGFYVPFHWKGELRVNGTVATATAMHMPADGGLYHVRGREREILGCILPRSRFVETVAALRGIGPEDVTLHDHAMELAPRDAGHLRRSLKLIIDRARHGNLGEQTPPKSFDLTQTLFELMLTTYLQVRPEKPVKSGRVRNPGHIVRAAEERFAQAGAAPVSLADLCAAAGVSKSALYLAFENWCGEPPLAYFHKRRLTQARSQLLCATPGRGAVKRAALDAGLTELSRFSRDYRRLFGEYPSTTLNRS